MNQRNIRERDHQVSLMGNIYSSAHSVFAYLGPEPPLGLHLFTSTQVPLDMPPNRDALRTCLDIFNREYWSRLWIMQELRLVQQAVFWCGSQPIPSFIVYGRCCWLLRHRPTNYTITNTLDDAEASILKGQIITFYDVGKGSVIQFLARFPFQWQVRHSLRRVLDDFCRNSCNDPRDKVFGLQALVREEQRISVDYSIPLERLALQTLRILIINEAKESENLGWSLSSDLVMARISALEGIAKYLSAGNSSVCRNVQALCWASLFRLVYLRIREGLQETAGRMITWRRIKALAITPRQILLAKALWATAQVHRIASWQEHPSENKVPDASGYRPQGAYLRRAIANLVAEHGFVMYGIFPFHITEWPFLNETPSATFSDIEQAPNTLPSQDPVLADPDFTEDLWPADDDSVSDLDAVDGQASQSDSSTESDYAHLRNLDVVETSFNLTAWMKSFLRGFSICGP